MGVLYVVGERGCEKRVMRVEDIIPPKIEGMQVTVPKKPGAVPKEPTRGLNPLLTPTSRGEAVTRVPHIAIGTRFALLFGQPL
jgi:hypothetical protein